MYHNFIIDSQCELGSVEAADSIHASLANNIFSNLSRDEHGRLRNLVTAAITSGESNAMIFPSDMHQLGYLASIRPAREVGYAVIALSDLCQPWRALTSEMLVDMFAITRAEAEIALLLHDGRDLDEIAVKRSVSRETIRTQVKSLLGKLDLPSQKRLVMLLSRVALALPGQPNTAFGLFPTIE